MKGKACKKMYVRTARVVLTMLLGLAVAFTAMPLAPVYADTSADWKAKMDKAQRTIDQCEAQLEKDQAALDVAAANLKSADDDLKAATEARDAAEYALNLRSDEYIYNKIKQAWPNDIARFKSYDSYIFNWHVQHNPDYESKGYEEYSDDYFVTSLSSSSNKLVSTAINTYRTKYGEDSFRQALVDTQGYYNTLEALDNIDRCNAIRADKTELAKFYVNVLGEPVPDNIPQLRISPYLMKISAVNVTLNGAGKVAHIYGCVSSPGLCNNGLGGSVDTSGSQNVTGGKFGDNTRIINPFEAWWNIENHNKIVSHNKTLCNPGFTATGFAITNPSKFSGYAVAGQDFKNPPKGYVSYSVEEYRSGLKSYCASKLAVYNSKLAAYDSVNARYEEAKSAYNAAQNTRDASKRALASAQSEYNRCKAMYESEYEYEQSTTYTIRFKDGLTGKLILQKTVTRCSYVDPPAPPVHEGYEFVGWDSREFKNVKKSVTISAVYTKIPGEQQSGDAPATENPSDPCQGSNVEDKTNSKANGKASVAPSRPKIVYVRMWKNKAQIKVKPVKGCKYQYQFRKKGTSKWISRKSAKNTEVLKKLKKNRTYQIRVRTYKKANGKTCYSKWETVNVKTTKKGTRTYR